MTPLLDAGVTFDLAIGNHDEALRHSDAGLRGDRVRDPPARHPRSVLHPHLRAGRCVVPRLERARPVRRPVHRAARVARRHAGVRHRPMADRDDAPPALFVGAARLDPAGRRGPRADPRTPSRRPGAGRPRSQLRAHGAPRRVTYVVSGGGCKTTKVGRSDFTAVSARILEFLHVDITGDRLVATCLQPAGPGRRPLRAQGAGGTVTRRPASSWRCWAWSSTPSSTGWSSWRPPWRSSCRPTAAASATPRASTC